MLELPQSILKSLSKKPFEHLMSVEGKVYRKQSKRQTEEIILNEEHYFIKKHYGITFKECLKNWSQCRQPIVGAKTEWQAIQTLSKLGISTTPLVGYGKQGYLPFTQRSFVLTKALQKTQSLEDYCKPWVVTSPPFKLKKNIIEEVARIARVLHQNHYYHRDFYLCHFLLKCDDEGEPENTEHPRLYLIDLHRLQHARFRNVRWQVKDLASLLFSAFDYGVTQRDILRFLHIYTDKPLEELQLDDKFWALVYKKAVSLYKKAHGRLPKQEMNPSIKLDVGVLSVEEELRILPERRWTVRGVLNNKAVVAKIFAQTKEFEREHAAALELAENNIPTPKLLHVTKTSSGESVLVYECLKHAKQASDVSKALVELFAQMHNSGLMQTDCHLDNFLIQEEKYYVIDAGGVKIYSKPLTVEKSLKNLALLFAQKPAFLQQKISSLWEAYVKERNWEASEALLEKFTGLVHESREYRLRKWTKKIFRNCSAFKCKKRFDKYFCIDRKIANIYSQTLCEYPEAYFHPKAEFLKQGQGVTVVHSKLDQDDIVIKRYNLKNWKKATRRLVSPSKAARAWRMAHILDAIGINVPKPLAFFERRLGLLRRQSYFVSAYCEGTRLDKYLEQNLSDKELDAIAYSLVEIMQKLSSAQCYHGDLKSLNFIWDGQNMWLLDFDGALCTQSDKRFAFLHQKDWARLYRNWDKNHPLALRLRQLQEQGNG